MRGMGKSPPAVMPFSTRPYWGPTARPRSSRLTPKVSRALAVFWPSSARAWASVSGRSEADQL